MCLLDGCRLDTFLDTIDEDADRFRSVGSTSKTWIQRTFDNHDVDNIAYITGNPYSRRTDTAAFGHYYEQGVEEIEGVETVSPTVLSNYAIQVWRQRNEIGIDQLIIHYMQPHVPFRSRPEWFEEWRNTGKFGSKAWKNIRSGEVSRDEFLRAYRDNLKWVWEEGVTRIRKNCDAKIAVTSDHGNAAGEWGYYGHPEGAPIPSVRHVPWLIITGEDHYFVEPSISLAGNLGSMDKEASLEALGYKQ